MSVTADSSDLQASMLRLEYFVLLSEVEHVMLADVLEFFPPDLSNWDVKKKIREADSDQLQFIDEGGDNLFIGLNKISEKSKQLIQETEKWKGTMCEVLNKLNGHSVTFKLFEEKVPRPSSVPITIPLKDVLRADKLHRFSWYGLDNMYIQGPLQNNIRMELIKQKLPDALSRAYYYILFSKKEFVRLEEIVYCFPAVFLRHDICNAIENDGMQRFVMISRKLKVTGKEHFVGLSSTKNEQEELLVKTADDWKNEITMELQKNDGVGVPLSNLARDRPEMLSQPKEMSKKIKILDILRSDNLRRFSISGSASNFCVTLIPQPNEKDIKVLESSWRKRIFEYLNEKKKSKLVVDLERNVLRPFGLNSNLVDVLKKSPNQITVTLNSRGQMIATVTPKSEAFNEQQLELWRQQVFEYLSLRYGPNGPDRPSSDMNPRKKTCKLSEVVKRVHEPWPMVWNGSIVSVLEGDQSKRFILDNSTIPGTYFLYLNRNSCANATMKRASNVKISTEEDHHTTRDNTVDISKGSNKEKWLFEAFSHLVEAKCSVDVEDLECFNIIVQDFNTSEELLDLLANDEKHRFRLSKSPMGSFSISMALPANHIDILCEEWRQNILKIYLSSGSAGPIKLTELEKRTDKPKQISRSSSLRRVLKQDPLGRFILTGQEENTEVKFSENSCSPCFNQLLRYSLAACAQKENTFEPLMNTPTRHGDHSTNLDEFRRLWCDKVAHFLAWQKKVILREDLGDVGVPSSLMRCDLVQVLRNDKLNRFSITANAKGMQSIGLQISEDEKLAIIKEWRIDVFNHFLKATRSDPSYAVEISKVAAHVPRPWLLPRSCTLMEALQDDPFKSFVLQGVPLIISLDMTSCPTSFVKVGTRTEDDVLKKASENAYIDPFNKDYQTLCPRDDQLECYRQQIVRFLVWHRRREESVSNLCSHYPEFDEKTVINILTNDPKHRFKVDRSRNNSTTVSLAVPDSLLRMTTRKWLDMAADFLSYRFSLNQKSRITLSSLLLSIPMQWYLPKDQFVIDLLRSDDRFVVGSNSGESSNPSVHLASAEKVAMAADPSSSSSFDIVNDPVVEKWREDILSYLYNCQRALTTNDIELGVPRPVNIPVVSMMNVLKSDPKERFSINKNARSLRLITPSKPDNEIAELIEEWKQNAVAFLMANKASKTTYCAHTLGKHIKRPWLIPRSYSLVNVLKSDALNRFVVDGKDCYAPVTLSHPEPSKSSAIIRNGSCSSSGEADSLEAESEDSDDLSLESYMKASRSYIENVARGVTQPELDRNIQKPDFVLDSFQTLLSDRSGRFLESRNSKHVRVITLSISWEEEKSLLEKWKLDIFSFVIKRAEEGSNTTVHDIGRNVVRPWLLPRPASLHDMLRNDPTQRFHLDGEGKRAIVTCVEAEKPSSDIAASCHPPEQGPEMIESIKEYLQKQQRWVSRAEVENKFGKDSFLYVETHSGDTFSFMDDDISVKITAAEREELLEGWRESMFKKLSDMSKEDPWFSASQSFLNAEVPLPWQIRDLSIENAIESDPSCRFEIFGEESSARVKVQRSVQLKEEQGNCDFVLKEVDGDNHELAGNEIVDPDLEHASKWGDMNKLQGNSALSSGDNEDCDYADNDTYDCIAVEPPKVSFLQHLIKNNEQDRQCDEKPFSLSSFPSSSLTDGLGSDIATSFQGIFSCSSSVSLLEPESVPVLALPNHASHISISGFDPECEQDDFGLRCEVMDSIATSGFSEESRLWERTPSLSPPAQNMVLLSNDIDGSSETASSHEVSTPRGFQTSNSAPATPPGLNMPQGIDNDSRNELFEVSNTALSSVPPKTKWADVVANTPSHVPLKDWLKNVFSGYTSEFVSELTNFFAKSGFSSCHDLIAANNMNKLTLNFMESNGYSLHHLEKLLVALEQRNLER